MVSGPAGDRWHSGILQVQLWLLFVEVLDPCVCMGSLCRFIVA